MIRVGCLLLILLIGVAGGAHAEKMTLDEAISFATKQTSRGEIIRGATEVAEQLYFARKMNFYLPEISINGSLPAYEISETYDYLPASDVKELGKETRLDFSSNITLSQSLITGGNFTARADLLSNDREYPLRGFTFQEIQKLGSFDFVFEQPILKPSEPKFQLKNRRDDLSIAKCDATVAVTNLTKDVIEAYFGVLQESLKLSIANDRLRSANLQTATDSVKLNEGVLSDEAWLETASARLDAELTVYEQESSLAEKKRQLSVLMDRDSGVEIETDIPLTPDVPSIKEQDHMLNNAASSVEVVKAHHEYLKKQREADYAASSHGLTGSISANYSNESGRVEVLNISGAIDDEGVIDDIRDDLDLNTWGVKLEFSYPLWDGGSSGAAVKAAQLGADASELQYNDRLKSARAEMANLLSNITVAHRKLGVLQQQIELADRKLTIARSRFEDGQISEIEYLAEQVKYLESQDKRLEELKKYFNNRAELEGKFSNL